MSLEQLPPELLRDIIDYAGVASFENVLLTCKQLYQCGQQRLARYNEMKKTFTQLGIMARQDYLLLPDLADYLLGIAMYPDIAYFARSLTIECVKSDEAPPGDDSRMYDPGLAWLRANGVNSDAEQVQRLAAQAITNNSWLRSLYRDDSPEVQDERLRSLCMMVEMIADVQRDEKHDSDMEKWDMLLRSDIRGVLNSLIAQLLVNLPRLQEFSCSWDLGLWQESFPSRDLLRIMSAHTEPRSRDHKQDSSPGKGALISPIQHLEVVHYCPEHHDPEQTDQDGDPIAFTEIAAFLRSRSIRKLHAHHICASSGVRDPWYDNGLRHIDVAEPKSHLPDFHSGLEHLELAASCIDEDGLVVLLKGLPYLTTFRYAHRHISHESNGVGWNACSFVKALSSMRPNGPDGIKYTRTLGEQIENLAISLDDEGEDICSGVTSLREFTVLKTLAIDVQIFLGPTKEQAEEQNEEVWDEWVTIRDDQRLINILPASLEELEIGIGHGDEKAALPDVERLFLGFAEGKNQNLPNLRKVSMRNWKIGGMSSPEWRKVGESLGADFHSLKDPRLHWRVGFDEMHEFYDREGSSDDAV